jgi:3-oxoacyl-[acyl-carrier-protein] synthase-3
MKSAIPFADAPKEEQPVMELPKERPEIKPVKRQISILGIGGYLPKRVVTTAELIKEFPDLTEEYIFGVTGIRQRHWVADEKPSDMALEAAREAIEKSGLAAGDIDAIVLSTETPDVCMPSTACILQEKLGLRGIPAFDIHAACSGWLYGISVAKGMILSGIGRNILVVGVDLQSRFLDKKDKGVYFLFGDGAGATVVADGGRGHVIKEEILLADAKGLRMARRESPGYLMPCDDETADPWIRLDGHALFRFATESFSKVVRDVTEKSGWKPAEVRWVVPHQANGRILKAAANKSGIPFDRFYLNIDHVGNTSSASIPLALIEIDKGLQNGDKLVLCSVGAGITAAAISVEW